MPAGAARALLISSNKPSVTASNVFGDDSGAAPAGSVVSTNLPNPNVTGGTPTYTYSWTHVSTASGNTPTVSNSAIANPEWDAIVSDGIPSESTWRLTVTDSVGKTGTVDILVTLTWTNLGA